MTVKKIVIGALRTVPKAKKEYDWNENSVEESKPHSL